MGLEIEDLQCGLDLYHAHTTFAHIIQTTDRRTLKNKHPAHGLAEDRNSTTKERSYPTDQRVEGGAGRLYAAGFCLPPR